MLTENLSPQQIEAVNTIDEDVEIIACAGAGKTGVVTRRIVNILKSKPDVKPENIVAFTFTKERAMSSVTVYGRHSPDFSFQMLFQFSSARFTILLPCFSA